MLVVGRIEPRKVFVGRPLHDDAAFASAFHLAAQRSQYSKWIAGVPRSMLAAFYRHSSFLLNVSFVEVSPLVDVEVLAIGCPVSTAGFLIGFSGVPADSHRGGWLTERCVRASWWTLPRAGARQRQLW